MAIEARFKMSKERLEEIKEELHYLETVREKEVSELIKEARSFGDLSENSEYDEAKTEQGKLYSKIAELRNIIENAEIIENTDNTRQVGLGSTVKVVCVDDNEEDEYQIVGSQEANPCRASYLTTLLLAGAFWATPWAKRLLWRHLRGSSIIK